MFKGTTILKLLVLTLVIAITFTAISTFGQVNANDLEVSCKNTECVFTSDSNLFNETNIYPTWSNTKSIKINNDHQSNRVYAVSISENSFLDSDPSLLEILDIKITNEDGKKIFDKNLSEFKKQNFVLLSPIKPEKSETFYFTVTMKNVGNEYQGLKASFNMNVYFIPYKESKDV